MYKQICSLFKQQNKSEVILTTKKKEVDSQEAERKLRDKSEELQAKEKELAVINNSINGDAAIQRANELMNKKKTKKERKKAVRENKLEDKHSQEPMPEPTKQKKEVSQEILDNDKKLAEGFLQALKDLGGSGTTHQIRKKLELPERWQDYNDSRIKNYALALEKANQITVDRTSRILVYKLKTE